MKNFNYIGFVLKALIVLFVFVMLLQFNKDNTINLNLKTLGILSPQGYAFFTRNPQEPQIYIYKFKNDSITMNISPKSTTSKMLFGISRANRRASLEFNEVFPKLTKWQDYEDINSYNEIIPDTLSLKSIDTRKKQGKYLIIMENRVPWAWSKNLEKGKRKFKIIYLK